MDKASRIRMGSNWIPPLDMGPEPAGDKRGGKLPNLLNRKNWPSGMDGVRFGCGGGFAVWRRLWLVVAVVSLFGVGFGCFSAVVSSALGWTLVGGVFPPTRFFIFCLTYPIGGILERNTKRPKRNNATRNHRRYPAKENEK